MLSHGQNLLTQYRHVVRSARLSPCFTWFYCFRVWSSMLPFHRLRQSTIIWYNRPVYPLSSPVIHLRDSCIYWKLIITIIWPIKVRHVEIIFLLVGLFRRLLFFGTNHCFSFGGNPSTHACPTFWRYLWLRPLAHTLQHVFTMACNHIK